MSVFDILADQRINEALRRGELDNLPGAGQPLDLSEEPFVGSDQRMVNRILRNAGFAPVEVSLRKEIGDLRDALRTLPEGEERRRMRRRLATLLLQLGELPRN